MSGPASHPTGGASSCPGADVDPGAVEECLGSVLARLRWGSDGVPEVAARATRLVLPVLTTLAALRPHLGPWDGIVHRRCRLVPLSGSGEAVRCGERGTGGGGDGAASPLTGATPAWSTAARDWRTLTVSLAVDGTEVTHWLARHEGGASGAPPRPGAGLRAGASVSTAVAPAAATARVPDPGAPCEARTATAAPAAAPPSGAGGGERNLLLTPADLASWARAAGDRNALHLVPGAAARAGLGAGGADVVAHGTLLAALSLAAAPARRADLRLIAPAVVPPGGLRLRLVPSGDVMGGGTVLLRRR